MHMCNVSIDGEQRDNTISYEVPITIAITKVHHKHVEHIFLMIDTGFSFQYVYYV